MILKDYKKFANSSDDFFKFKAGGILEKIHSTDEFLVKNSKDTVHLAAILNRRNQGVAELNIIRLLH